MMCLNIFKNALNINNKITLKTSLYNQLPTSLEKDFLDNKKDIGLCFSGGGPRSFSATLGYIRALYELDLLKDVKYISGISGSTWLLIPFIFSKDTPTFLGLNIFNKNTKILTNDIIKYTNDKYIGNSLISLASNKQLIEYMYEGFEKLENKSRVFPYMLGKIFLEPYNLMNNKFLAPNKEIANYFNSFNSHIDYLIPNENLPFLICSTNIAKPDKEKTLINTDFNLIEMTPFYSGTLSKLTTNSGTFGGSLLNTYSYSPTTFKNNTVELNNNHFNLYDIIGSSSTAYGIITNLLGLSCANPSYNLVDAKLNKICPFDCVDGGVLDNAGIVPMLRRKVKNIVLFVNTSSKIDVSNGDMELTKSIDIMLRQLFLGDNEVNKETYLYHFEYINNLKVFRNGEERWKELIEKIRHNIKESDNAFVELKDLEVLRNDNYQIEEYILDRLQIVYLYQTKDWTNNRLDKDIEMPENFPYYDTVFQNDGWIEKELLALIPEEVNLLADMTYYNLIKNKEFMNLFL